MNLANALNAYPRTISSGLASQSLIDMLEMPKVDGPPKYEARDHVKEDGDALRKLAKFIPFSMLKMCMRENLKIGVIIYC